MRLCVGCSLVGGWWRRGVICEEETVWRGGLPIVHGTYDLFHGSYEQ